MKDISIIAPCYNEAENIPELTERVLRVFDNIQVNGELILVDDGSTDSTKKVIEKEIARNPNRVRGFFNKKNGGIETAWRSGLTFAEGYLICFIDADLQNLPEDIARLWRFYWSQNTDCVQGWRSSIGRDNETRYYVSVVLNALLNLLFFMRAKDNKSGFMLARKDVMNNILQHQFTYSYFQTLIRVAAHAKKYTVGEVETLFEKRKAGKSFLSNLPIKVIVLTFVDIFKAFIEYRILYKKSNFFSEYLTEHSVLDRSPHWSIFRRLYFKIYLWILPLHHWMLGRAIGKDFWILRKTQWLSVAGIKDLQFKRFQALIGHAYRHVPYYRECFDKRGLKPTDFHSLDDLLKLPFLDKKTVRERLYFDLLSDNHIKKNMLQISTSGSTGEPFICYSDKDQLEMRWAATLRSQEWTGYRFGDRCVRLWHQTIGMKRSQIWREQADAFLLRRKFIPAFQINDDNIFKLVYSIESFQPVFIDGYAESLNLLASYLKQHQAIKIKPKAIMSSAQTLPRQSREVIEQSFGCNIFDKYGSREFSGIAYECDHNNHHVVAESYIIEIIKDGRPAKPGEIGEVVITDLNNYSLPFVRYRIGDVALAVAEKCTCGRGLPLIGDIQGRAQSIILGTRKQYIPGAFFAHLFKDYEYAIKQFQVEQNEFGKIILRIVKAQRFTQKPLDELCAVLEKHLGPGLLIDVEFLDYIPLGRTGKFHHSISHLPIDFQVLSS